MERADQVLSGGGVDPGLPADRGIDHREQRRRHVDDPDAAQPGRRGETGHVGRRSAADGDDDVGPCQLQLAQLVPQRAPRSRATSPARPRRSGHAPPPGDLPGAAGPASDSAYRVTAGSATTATAGAPRHSSTAAAMTPWPTTTSYGELPPTGIRRASQQRLDRGRRRPRCPSRPSAIVATARPRRTAAVARRAWSSSWARGLPISSGPVAVHADPRGRVGEADVEEHDAVAGERGPGSAGRRLRPRRAPARRRARRAPAGPRPSPARGRRPRRGRRRCRRRCAGGGLHVQRRCRGTPRRAARRRSWPTVVLPAPGGPTRTSNGRHVTTRCCEVGVAVAPGLGDRVAAELLEHRVGEHERDHRLRDHARSPAPRRHRSAG